jgi:hypothetical protein
MGSQPPGRGTRHGQPHTFIGLSRGDEDRSTGGPRRARLAAGQSAGRPRRRRAGCVAEQHRREVTISSRSPDRRHCRLRVAPKIPTSLSPAAACAVATARSNSLGDEVDPGAGALLGWSMGEHEDRPLVCAVVDPLDPVHRSIAMSYQRRPARIAPILFIVSSASEVGWPRANAQSIESSGPATYPSSDIV